MTCFERPEPAIASRGIHLDLKGLPPTPVRLLQLLELMAECRINLALVEWEDAFPWRDPALRSPTAYSADEVAAVVARAAELGIELVPLVQCFGHLQTLLLGARYHHLREVPDRSDDLCPSHPEAQAVIRGLIDEIIDAHPGARRIHLGCDEVWSLGSCERCAARVAADGRDGLFLGHVEPLLDHVAARGLMPAIWDDMLRTWPTGSVARIAPKAELVCWSYIKDPESNISADAFDRFAAAGITCWGASAFRGADGDTADHPDTARRMGNLQAWAELAPRRGIGTVVATGWARYSTIQSPCESLESSLVELVLAALAMWNGDLGADAEATAEAMLDGDLAAWAGDWRRVRAAARDLGAWRRQRWEVEHLVSHAALNGEPERADGAPVAGVARLHAHVAKGEALVAAWAEAHRGLVPDRWLDLYATARLVWPRHQAAAVEALVQRRLALQV